ncbi:MAG: hypothetical protein QXG44_02645 [Candidatus Jordarchaeaceae archaeon]
MKRKMIVAAAVATLALFVLAMSLPALTTPATAAANLPTTEYNTQEKSVESLDWWDNWFDSNTKSFFTNMFMCNFSQGFVSGNFTHRALANSRFGLNFAKLVEFNDTNNNQCYDNGTDKVLKEYNLVTDVNWTKPLTIELGPLIQPMPPIFEYIKISVEGTEKTGAFNIAFGILLYFTSKNVSFGNSSVTVPKLSSLKFELNITNYNWQGETPENPYSSRFLALVITLHSCLGDSLQYRYRWAEGAVVANGESGLVPSLVNNEGVSEVEFIDSWGIPVAEFSWFNGAYNSTQDPCHSKSTFILNNETLTISIAFSHENFSDGNIYIDPYFALLEPNYLPLILTIGAIYMFYAKQAVSNLLIYGGVAAAAIVLLVLGVAVVLARRR